MGYRFYAAKRMTALGSRGSTRIRLRSHSGQTLVEYALVLSFISVVAIGVLMATGGTIKGIFTTVSNQLSVSSNGGPFATPPGH